MVYKKPPLSELGKTKIEVFLTTKERLKKHGTMIDSYDTVINKAIDALEKKAKK